VVKFFIFSAFKFFVPKNSKPKIITAFKFSCRKIQSPIPRLWFPPETKRRNILNQHVIIFPAFKFSCRKIQSQLPRLWFPPETKRRHIYKHVLQHIPTTPKNSGILCL